MDFTSLKNQLFFPNLKFLKGRWSTTSSAVQRVQQPSSNSVSLADKHLPLVSVIIPAYNASAFITQTLASVVAQTYTNLEILVINDGSTDNTVKIVQQYAHRDRRIHLLQQPNAGVAAARNLGIQQAKGEFVAPIDADDIWAPNTIASQVEALQTADADVGLVYAWSADINETGQLTGGFKAARVTGNVYNTLVGHNFIGNASATLIRRCCLDAVGSYNTSLRKQNAQGCEDLDLYLRIAEHYPFQVVPQFLVGYRKATNSMSCDYSTMAKSHALVLATVQQHHPNLPLYLYRLSKSNLYMYFAYQSDRQQQPRNTRFWLREALTAEPLTTLIRFRFYQLGLRSILTTVLPIKNKHPLTAVPVQANELSSDPLTELANFTAPALKLHLMLIVGDFYRSLIDRLVKQHKQSATDASAFFSMVKKP